MQDFGLAPSEFWEMTPSEFDLLTRDRIDREYRKAGLLTEQQWGELDEIGRRAIEKERQERGGS